MQCDPPGFSFLPTGEKINDLDIKKAIINLTFTSLNVRSLNISSISDKTSHKIQCIIKKGTDIILLSDLRLNSEKQRSATEDITKKFLLKGYDFVHNALTSNRGAGILISKKLNATVQKKTGDQEGNFILIDLCIGDSIITIGSIYGPNINENIYVYDSLVNALNNMNKNIIVLGGDWNCTWDSRGIEDNIDCLNMVSIPSRQRSEKVKNISELFGLTDPYRSSNPNKREFSYVPSVAEYTNRSRIDFFLVTKNLLQFMNFCSIDNTLSSGVFDHKKIYLSFESKKKIPKNKQLQHKYLENTTLIQGVTVAAKECYIHHATINENFTEEIKNNILTEIGLICTRFKEINDLEEKIIADNINDLERHELEAKKTLNELAVEALPVFEFFETLDLTCNHEFFFEALTSSVRNAALWAQSNLYTLNEKYELNLIRELNILKQDYAANQDEIFAKERILTNHIEKKLRDEIMGQKKFEILNAEKITPYFVNLVKCTKSEDSLSGITDDAGIPFNNIEDRNEHIRLSYENLYKKPNANILEPDCIADFLGEVNNNATIINAKLTENEKLDLESPITIEELDLSINTAKMKSAPGADGYSNKFIRKFWNIFRLPLFRTTMFAFNNNKLSDSFRSANIKLIPKKGDLSLLKNWRPISLLSCFYKVISRAISNRLKKYMDKLTPTCQKGYSTTRRCQEVLIGILNGIDECKKL